MKMMFGNNIKSNLLVSGAEPECGGIWWDATMLWSATSTLAVPVTFHFNFQISPERQ